MCLCRVCAWAHRCPQRPEESIVVHGAGVIGSFKLSEVVAGNQTEEQIHALNDEPSLHVPFIFYKSTQFL